MPRPTRADEAGAIYHALNRANLRSTIIPPGRRLSGVRGDFGGEALERGQVELFGYEFMPNHGHLVLRDGEMGGFMKWVSGTHTMRYDAYYHGFRTG